ncbi:MAG: NAD(P)H-dependent oxidoreductase [Actinomycetota bacterium]|nr:NAD(P)H-dependent oxidoreductase [Actinomycetota bacterium]
MSPKPQVLLGISGSLRRDSFNTRLLARAGSQAPHGIRFETFDRLGELPHFSQDLEDNTPSPVTALRSALGSADVVMFASPEYNSAMPGVLKNALDWASRPTGHSVLADKPTAVLGASPGRYGAVRAQAEVRKVLGAIGADVLDEEFPLARAHEAFDSEGRLRDGDLDAALAEFVATLVRHAGLHTMAPGTRRVADSAAYSRQCQHLAS